jgi:hypothetical protein
MPVKIPMILSNNHTNKPDLKTRTIQTNIAQTPVTKSSNGGMYGSMVARIHTIKPGCGSCGR